MMTERGVEVDHSSIYRWVRKFTPKLEATFRKERKYPISKSWRMDETYIKIKDQWRYLYLAVDKAGQTVDFLLATRRDKKDALRFLEKAMRLHSLPDKVTIDKSGANTAAIEVLQEETGHKMVIIAHSIEYAGHSIFREMGNNNQVKKCPYCAESINREAILCRFCGKDV